MSPAISGEQSGLDSTPEMEEHLRAVHQRLVNYCDSKKEDLDYTEEQEDPEVVYIDRRSRPRVIFSGEDLVEVKMPIGSRVIYPKKPIKPLGDVSGAIRYAIDHPDEEKPLRDLLSKGMQVTIAIDDLSLPLPAMAAPDLRKMMLEIVLEQLAGAGIEDIHIVIATAFHRRMTNKEIITMLGKEIFERFSPNQIYNHDGEDEDKMKWLGHTEKGEIVKINRRAAESDILIYLNINFVPMNGGAKSVATGLAGYATLREHHDPEVIAASNSYMDVSRSSLQDANSRINAVIEEKVKVFRIETVLNNRMFSPPLDFLGRNEDSHSRSERILLAGLKKSLASLSPKLKRQIFQRIPAGYECIAVHAGAVQPVHKKIIRKSYQQYEIKVRRQADILVLGIPYVCPYSVNSILNPLLVQVMALGYIYHLFVGGSPLIRDGGSMIIFHPCRDEFDECFHPSYVDFFNRLLPISTDSRYLQRNYEMAFAKDQDYIHLYRNQYAYHGVHPFYMWYWGESGRRRLKKIIVVGVKKEHQHVPTRMGWENADDFSLALKMAGYSEGSNTTDSPQVTLLHLPPMLMTRIIGEGK